VTRGIGCSSCHGRIDKMEIVQQDQKLSMGWCLDCHRAPEQHIRPKDQITNMEWKLPQTEQVSLGRKLLEEYHINPSVHCSVCHR
jgi:tRNA(Phe) wybutosine-synthesizing methylase Tyw3